MDIIKLPHELVLSLFPITAWVGLFPGSDYTVPFPLFILRSSQPFTLESVWTLYYQYFIPALAEQTFTCHSLHNKTFTECPLESNSV